MSVLIQHKRGLRANLPASAPAGEEYFCTDTHEVFMGTGSGIVLINANDAKSINGVPITGTPDLGKIPIGQGDGTAVFADPLVQGLQAEGTTATGLNPVLIAGKGADGNIHDVSVDNTGKLNIANFPATQTVAGSVSVSNFPSSQAVTGTVSVSNFPSSFTANIGTTNGLALDASVTNPQVTAGTTTAPTKIDIVGGKTSDATAQYQPIPLTAAGAAVNVSVSNSPSVSVSNFPATQTVSGTVTANIGTTNGLALDATLTGGTQKTKLIDSGGTNVATVSAGGALKVDNSAVTQPVSGTVTANIGTSGSLALDASVTGLQVSQGSTTSGQKGSLILGAVTTAAPSYTTAQSSPLSLTTVGALRVDGSAVTQPISAASLPLPSGAATSAKQPALGTAGTASSDVITVQGIASMTALKVDGSAVTQPVSIAATVATKTVPQTSGGMPLPFSASVSATKQQVKGSSGQVYGYHILNNTAAIAYMQVFDKTSASVTVGTTAPDYVIPLPASFGATLEISTGIAHANGITVACTTTRTGSTGAACDVVVFFN